MVHLSSETRLISQTAIGARLIACSCLWLFPRFLPAFDTSADAIIGKGSHLEGFVRWDTLHMILIALTGYTFEQQYAFLPGLPLLMRYSGHIIRVTIGSHVLEPWHAVLGGIILANLATVFATLVLYK